MVDEEEEDDEERDEEPESWPFELDEAPLMLAGVVAGGEGVVASLSTLCARLLDDEDCEWAAAAAAADEAAAAAAAATAALRCDE